MPGITEKSRKLLLFALASAFIWGLAAHGYAFAHSSFSHDSLSEFHAAFFGNIYKVQLGRFVVPFYRVIFRTNATMPWLIGCLTLLWIGLSVFLTMQIFKVNSRLTAFLAAGIFTVNISISALAATYIHDLDCNMFALLCAVCSAFLWRRYRFGWLIGSVFVTVSLGIYQSFICVALSLVMFSCVLALMDGEDFSAVFFSGLKAIGMFILGGIFYFAAVKLMTRFTGIELLSGEFNSLDNAFKLNFIMVVSLLRNTYLYWGHCLLNAYSPWAVGFVYAANILLFLAAGYVVLRWAFSRKAKVPSVILCLLLLVLLPLVMDIMYILNQGNVHDLMNYSFWLVYLLMLLLVNRGLETPGENGTEGATKKVFTLVRGICIVLVFVLLYGNVQTANSLHLQKELESDAFLSYMTRVMYKIEDYDDYAPGQTPVVFVGEPEQIDTLAGFEGNSNVTGFRYNASPFSDNWIVRPRAYFEYVMNIPIALAEDAVWEAMQTDERVKDMPAYPGDGCIVMVDDVLVVKLG